VVLFKREAWCVVVDMEVLGPLVVKVNGRLLRLGPTLRVLLLCLLCAQGDLVPAGRLAVLASRAGAAEFSPATLRSHVSHLRRALDDAAGQDGDAREPVIVTDRTGGGTGYALRPDAVRVDAARFAQEADLGLRELHAGDAARAADTLRAALRLWRGQPLADVADYPFAQAEIRHLEAARRAALAARLDADVRCGRHGSIIGELQALVTRWPGDEALRELLVVCLYRSGRVAEAARACRDAVGFAVEHGLESQRLTALQRQVLTGTLQGLSPAAVLA
jgi:DNA-binding SARP family transcriptional activator